MNGSNWLSATLAIVWHRGIVSVSIGLRTDTTGVLYKAYINDQNRNIFTIKEKKWHEISLDHSFLLSKQSYGENIMDCNFSDEKLKS